MWHVRISLREERIIVLSWWFFKTYFAFRNREKLCVSGLWWPVARVTLRERERERERLYGFLRYKTKNNCHPKGRVIPVKYVTQFMEQGTRKKGGGGWWWNK